MIRQRLCIALALLAGLQACSAQSEQQAALEYLESHRQRFDQDLIELTAIPSVSALPSRAQDVLQAAEWLKARLQLAGVEVGPRAARGVLPPSTSILRLQMQGFGGVAPPRRLPPGCGRAAGNLA